MTVRFSKRQLFVFVLMLTVLGAAIIGLYFYMLYPRYQQIEELNNTVASEKKILAATRAEIAKQKSSLPESVVELQKKIPVKPLTEQLLLDLEKAEVVSDSTISSMTFNEEENATGEQQKTDASSKTEQSSSRLPDGLKKVTVQLTVQSPSYYQLERFLQTLENLNRIVSIESLSFTGNPELTSVDTEVNPLTYSVTVSAFYYPKLAKLQNMLPQIDVPPPSKKRNPLTEIIPEGQPSSQQ
ncbi:MULTISPECIES: pilus assembly protein PilO [unclassified Geobacillus]|uniref:pilus assembly protein PilO n=1 Tax=unclassified Geobacillus TaxID=2642459 RepID=UPI000D337D98|nr:MULTISPECIES: pilus assembly protein PilO [unclassified Geobacillus]PUF89962.1 pilus assembly protein PilO [Geobacillus sp. LYN3]RDV22119.1 pilus assembly protein PilO [Parageobacillus toebii]TXK89137.1 pilus assembly protein PilO [Geobacillus sp. AYS3]